MKGPIMNTSPALSCLGPGIPPVIINVAIIIIVSIIGYYYMCFTNVKSIICLGFMISSLVG